MLKKAGHKFTTMNHLDSVDVFLNWVVRLGTKGNLGIILLTALRSCIDLYSSSWVLPIGRLVFMHTYPSNSRKVRDQRKRLTYLVFQKETFNRDLQTN